MDNRKIDEWLVQGRKSSIAQQQAFLGMKGILDGQEVLAKEVLSLRKELVSIRILQGIILAGLLMGLFWAAIHS